MTDQELSNELSAEKIATANGVPNGLPTEQVPSDEVPIDEHRQGGHISIRRAWTSTENYRLALTVQPSDSGFDKKIEAITWVQRQGHTSKEQAKTDVIILCRSQLGCSLDAAPDYDKSEFTSRGV